MKDMLVLMSFANLLKKKEEEERSITYSPMHVSLGGRGDFISTLFMHRLSCFLGQIDCM